MSGHSVHIKVDGRTYSGTYLVERKTLTVTTSFGKKSAPVSQQIRHDTLAHQLLQELVCRKGSQGFDTLILFLRPSRARSSWSQTSGRPASCLAAPN